jgi:hypothetical protein
MDMVHIFLSVGMLAMVGMAGWASVNVTWSLDSIAQTQERIAKTTDRTERMTQDILLKVHGMRTPNA